MIPTNKFRLKYDDDGQVRIQNVVSTPEANYKEIKGQLIAKGSNKVEFRAEESEHYLRFDAVFDDCVKQISEMNLTHSNEDKIYKILTSLFDENSILIKNLNGRKQDSAVIDCATEHVIDKIKGVSTRYRREKLMKKQLNFVPATAKSIDVKWKSKRALNSDLPCYDLPQTTFQYVSIKRTLQSLFAQPEFAKTYFEYNENHECVPGIYKSFCCAQNHKDLDIHSNEHVVDIVISVDDFEVCAVLKSKTKKHKECGVYFHVNNFPLEYRSQLSNIFLIALAKTEDLKETEECFDNIAEIAVNELKELEKTGFSIVFNGKKIQMKVALINISFDNLGGNSICGFQESFNSEYYCRICECTKSECQVNTEEVKSKLRTKSAYLEYFSKLSHNDNVDVVATKGIKKYCLFNELTSYHTFINTSVDVMHDVFEGVELMFLKLFFDYCVSNTTLTRDDIVALVRDFKYGIISNRNKPSPIIFSKSNLNQSASQINCITLHLPFIFFEYRDQLKRAWPVMTDLLRCVQIVRSTEIDQPNVVRLKKKTTSHYDGVKEIFIVKLKPKQHMFIHYASIIEMQGPPIQFWMMREENKHQIFTGYARGTNNFVNIPKTLAEKHQKSMFAHPFQLNKIENSKKRQKFMKSRDFVKYESAVKNSFDKITEEMEVINFFSYANYRYEHGTMIIEDFNVFEIKCIISQNEKNYLVLNRFDVVGFKDFCNSIEVTRNENEFIVKEFHELKNKQSYEIIFLNGSMYIIADTLMVFNKFND